jgi:hypothetical protein
MTTTRTKMTMTMMTRKRTSDTVIVANKQSDPCGTVIRSAFKYAF